MLEKERLRKADAFMGILFFIIGVAEGGVIYGC